MFYTHFEHSTSIHSRMWKSRPLFSLEQRELFSFILRHGCRVFDWVISYLSPIIFIFYFKKNWFNLTKNCNLITEVMIKLEDLRTPKSISSRFSNFFVLFGEWIMTFSFYLLTFSNTLPTNSLSHLNIIFSFIVYSFFNNYIFQWEVLCSQHFTQYFYNKIYVESCY